MTTRAASDTGEELAPREAWAEDVRAYASRVRASVEAKLDELAPAETEDPSDLHEAVRWSLFAPAKRFRPLLVFAAGESFGATQERVLRTACAFELIHTYSLIHDDLPAMDDDDLRRGRPTCHVKFGEDVAILAGDGLFAEAIRLVLEQQAGEPAQVLGALEEIVDAASVAG